MPGEIKDEYTETDINMWGMEIKRINAMLQALTDVKLAIHNAQVMKQSPQVVNMVSDIIMELYLTIDAYMDDAAKKASMFERAEKLQDEAELIVRDFKTASDEGEDYDNPEQLFNFYRQANHLHKDIMEELDILGLRIPFKTKHSIDALLKKANK